MNIGLADSPERGLVIAVPELERDKGDEDDPGAQQDHSYPRPNLGLPHMWSLGVTEPGKEHAAEPCPWSAAL